MEELLNKLIEKGWKPFGKTGINERDCFVYMNNGHCIRLHKGVYADNMLCGQYDLRQLTSKESGIWQFCCENKLIKSNGYCNGWAYHNSYDEYAQGDGMDNEGELQRYYDTDYQYYIIESALCDEEDLDKFLLENIKIS